jgi:hypothetical protein
MPETEPAPPPRPALAEATPSSSPNKPNKSDKRYRPGGQRWSRAPGVLTWTTAAFAGTGAGAAVFVAIDLLPLHPVARIALASAGGLGTALGVMKPTAELVGPAFARASAEKDQQGSQAAGSLTVCYVGADRVWARWAAATLAAAGYTTDLHDVRFVLPATLRRHALLIGSYAFALTSDAAAAALRLSAAVTRSVVTIRVDDCPLPEGTTADAELFTGMAEDRARDAILHELTSRGLQPAQPQPGAGQPARYPGGYPRIWRGVPPANPAFTGRHDLLRDLAETLIVDERDEVTTRACALHGIGGVGKSTLAIAFAYRFRAYYDAVTTTR